MDVAPAFWMNFYFQQLNTDLRIMNIDALRVLDGIDQCVYLKDKNGVYRYVNDRFLNTAGLDSRDAIIGKGDRDLICKINAERWAISDEQVLAGKSIIRAEEVHYHAGRELKIIITKTPYRANDNDGEILGVLGSFFDCAGRLILETKGEFDEQKRRLYLEFVPDWLSAAEVQVCFYLIYGFSAPRIAKKIDISVSTVRFHIENIKNKMQCANKGEIVEVAMRTGIAWKIFSLQRTDTVHAKNGR